MKTKFRFALASAAIAALGVIAAPAMAEKVAYVTPSGQVVATTTTDEIVVVPYGPYRERTGRRSATGFPEETIHVSRVVTARDLDLRYDGSVHELYRRIEYTARQACDEADRASRGVSLTSDRQCVRDAMRGAEPQVEALIYRARY